MMLKLFAGLCLSFVIMSSVVPDTLAQSPYAYVSSDSITVGDRFGLILVVPRPAEAQIARPIFSAPNGASTIRFGDLIIFKRLSAGQVALASGDLPLADTLVYEAATFALDSAFVPPLRLRLVTNTDTVSVATTSFVFPVVSLTEEGMEDIVDITPIASFPPALWPWFLLIGIALAAYLIFRYRDRLRIEDDEEEEEEPEIPRDPPFVEAMQRFEAMEASGFSNEMVKEYFVELTDIVRVYLSRRIQIPALESTSTELLYHLKKWREETTDEAPLETKLAAILETADLAKFADSHPAEELSRKALSQSRELVEQIEEVVDELEQQALRREEELENADQTDEAVTEPELNDAELPAGTETDKVSENVS
ncbi:MAG: hypothetical protein HKN43_09740 [Rhodothermales bacterium]|nr:hypothetical protein [Rhodothermales bacterium]